MTRPKLPPCGKDLRIAAQFGTGEAFDTALDTCARAWRAPEHMRPGEWKQLQAGLFQLAQSMQSSLASSDGDGLIQTLLDHPAPALHALAAYCLPHGWTPARRRFMPKLTEASPQVQACLIQALSSLPSSDRSSIAQGWLNSRNPVQQALGVYIYPAEPPAQVLTLLRNLRPVENQELGEAVITRIGELALLAPGASEEELSRWASNPLHGDGFLLSRCLSRIPLRTNLPFSLAILDTLLKHHPSPEQDAQYITAALRALAREHGDSTLRAQLDLWLQSPSKSVRRLAAKANRRIEQD